MIPRGAIKLMKLGKIVMENISEVDVLNAVPSREAVELISTSHPFNHRWEILQHQDKMYGDTFITHLNNNIDEVFERRERDKGEKIIEEIMEVKLQSRYIDD